MKKLMWPVAFLMLVCGLMNEVMAETVIRFSWWGGAARKQATLNAIALFEKKNPGIKIRPEAFEWSSYEENLKVLMFGRSEPDVMQVGWAFLMTMSKNGNGFYDLGLQKQLVRSEDFHGSSISSGIVKGKLNALPISDTARFILWQQSMLDKAGVKPPVTWDDLFAMGPAFKQKLGDAYYPLDGGLFDMVMLSHAYIYQKTGRPFIDTNTGTITLNQAEAQEWIHFFKRLYDEHVCPDWKTRLGKGGENTPLQKYPEWKDGHWAGTYIWNTSISLYTDALPKTTKAAIYPLPTVAKPLNSGYFGRPSMLYAVSKNSKNPDVAVRFVNFMLHDPDAARLLGTQRGLPLSKSAYAVIQREKMAPPLDIRSNDLLMNAKIDIPSPFYDDSRMRDVIRGVFEAVAFGKINEKEAATRLLRDASAAAAKMRVN